MQPTTSSMAPTSLHWRSGWRYGLMGLPLAFVALPLYVLLPNFYARNFGMSLATLGAVLLAVRLFDAVIDPLLGRWVDRLNRTGSQRVLQWAAWAAVAMCVGFALLFFPPPPLQQTPLALMGWLAATLLLSTVAFSALSILHNAWGARLGGNPLYRSQVVAWREGFGLVGVIIAAVAPVTLGIAATAALLTVACVAGWWAWRSGPSAASQASNLNHAEPPQALWAPWLRINFRRLMAVFMVNGIASAVPATLMLFFVQDRLQAPASAEPLFLGSYFLAAAVSIPLWLKLVPRLGLARTWGLGMVLSVAVFMFAAALGAGDVGGFWLVCVLSGVALGTDLAVPAALLTGVIQTNGDQQRLEGAYFGWWAFAAKLNLALAAGIALPVLGWLGYTPGATDAQALHTLTLAYCVLPCALKALAGVLLYFLIIRKTP